MRRVVIVGRSAGALDEYAKACALCTFDDVIVVGKMGEAFPDRIDYWVSFHPNLFARWAAIRAARHLPPAARFWGPTYRGRQLDRGVMTGLPIEYVACIGGSSGYMAVEGALDVLRADRVVLAGIPLTAEAGHAVEASEPKEVGRPWDEAAVYWATWEENAARLRGRVCSMSGRTQNLLGAPTRAWLEGGELS